MTDPIRLQSQAADVILCKRHVVIVETNKNKTLRDQKIPRVVILTPAVGNDRVTEMTGFAFLTVPSDGVAETVYTFARDAVTGSFVAVARLASGTDYQRVSVVRRSTPVKRTKPPRLSLSLPTPVLTCSR